jgi:hypothetical protein
VWQVILCLLALALGAYLHLRRTCFFTERAFMKAYHRELRASSSHPAALRAALRTFEHRAPFNALSQEELDHACLTLSALFDAHPVARIVRVLDRARDARLLANEQFLRGVVYTHAGLWH